MLETLWCVNKGKVKKDNKKKSVAALSRQKATSAKNGVRKGVIHLEMQVQAAANSNSGTVADSSNAAEIERVAFNYLY